MLQHPHMNCIAQKSDCGCIYDKSQKFRFTSMAPMDLRSIVLEAIKDNIIFYDSINITVYWIRAIVLKLLIVSSKSFY
jgi:hypothetical protein